jgi:membrane protein
MGDEGARAIQSLLKSVSQPGESVAATLFGVVLLFIGATTVFAELQDDLDRIWRAPERNKSSGLWGLLRARLLSFGMILGLAFLLLVSLVASTAVAVLGEWWGPFFIGWEVVAHALNIIVSFALITVIFAMIYKIMPRVQIRWHDVWIGAAVTSLLFAIGKFLIGLYIGKSGITSGFGAAGSLVAMLVWVYYSAQIFLLGAEFTWTYSNTYGSRKGMAQKTKGQQSVERKEQAAT